MTPAGGSAILREPGAPAAGARRRRARHFIHCRGGEGEIDRDFRVNERIRAREVRLIDDTGAQLGVVPVREALRIAGERQLDLIEVAPNASPPVCRIMDFGKHKYQQAKRDREARKRQRSSEVRLLRMRPQIGEHDLMIKLRKLREILMEGDKVRISVRFRGREMSRPELGTKLFDRITEELADIAQSEGVPRREGRMMNMMLAPKASVKPAPAKGPKAGPQKPAKAAAAEAGKAAPEEAAQAAAGSAAGQAAAVESPPAAAEKREKATKDVQEEVSEKPVAEQPPQVQDAEDSGEAG